MKTTIIGGLTVLLFAVSPVLAATVTAGSETFYWTVPWIDIPIMVSGDGTEQVSAVDLRVSIVGESPQPLFFIDSLHEDLVGVVPTGATGMLDVSGALFVGPQFHTALKSDATGTEATGGAADFSSPRTIPAGETLLAVLYIDTSTLTSKGMWQLALSNSLGDTSFSPPAISLVSGTLTASPEPSTLILLLAGAVFLLVWRRCRKRAR